MIPSWPLLKSQASYKHGWRTNNNSMRVATSCCSSLWMLVKTPYTSYFLDFRSNQLPSLVFHRSHLNLWVYLLFFLTLSHPLVMLPLMLHLPQFYSPKPLPYMPVATYPSMRGRVKSQRCVFQKGEGAGVATNVYLRKTLEKPKRGLRILKRRVRELYLRMGKVLAPHASVTKDENL